MKNFVLRLYAYFIFTLFNDPRIIEISSILRTLNVVDVVNENKTSVKTYGAPYLRLLHKSASIDRSLCM